MTKCDHTSVGMIIRQNDRLLLIERKNFPWGFAPPAGHVDGDSSYEIAAKREIEEEVGLQTKNLKLLTEGRKENKCRREDGNWHYWKIYAANTEGDLERNINETKQAGWHSKREISDLAKKTEEYLINQITDKEWEKSPGIEPIWYEWFKELKII